MYAPDIDAGTVHAVRLAFQRQRSAARNWKSRQHAGRLDGRSVWRNEARLDVDIFRDKRAPGATKVNVHILVDGSGSMTAPSRVLTREEDMYHKAHPYEPIPGVKTRIQQATDVAATLVQAFQSISSVRLNVWLHQTARYGRDEADLSILSIIRNGKGKENLGYLPQAAGGGNGDGYAIKWVSDLMVRETRSDEVGLLIVVSDGLPSWLAPYVKFNVPAGDDSRDATKMVFNVVNDVRDRGIRVLSVGIAADMTGQSQYEMYGKENVIPFDPTVERAWTGLAVTFGAVLGDTLAQAAEAKARGRRR